MMQKWEDLFHRIPWDIIDLNINLTGATSITAGADTDLGNGKTKTKGVTIGLNTGLVVGVITWIYKVATTGDISPIPGFPA